MSIAVYRSFHLARNLASRKPHLAVSPTIHVARCSMSSKEPLSMTDEDIKLFKQNEARIKEELLREAGFLTKSIYRTCLRSVRLIRPGNETDEADFQERERKEGESSFGSKDDDDDVRMGVFSMLPPVDREDELRSRAEYYHQYARENLAQEKDCLPLRKGAVGRLSEYDVERFVSLLKKGEKARRWLLQDMRFPDPHKNSFPKERTQQFVEKATKYIQQSDMAQSTNTGLFEYEVEEDNGEEDVADPFDGIDDDVPQWILDKYPHLAPKTR